jgi:hypothetical protein
VTNDEPQQEGRAPLIDQHQAAAGIRVEDALVETEWVLRYAYPVGAKHHQHGLPKAGWA